MRAIGWVLKKMDDAGPKACLVVVLCMPLAFGAFFWPHATLASVFEWTPVTWVWLIPLGVASLAISAWQLVEVRDNLRRARSEKRLTDEAVAFSRIARGFYDR